MRYIEHSTLGEDKFTTVLYYDPTRDRLTRTCFYHADDGCRVNQTYIDHFSGPYLVWYMGQHPNELLPGRKGKLRDHDLRYEDLRQLVMDGSMRDWCCAEVLVVLEQFPHLVHEVEQYTLGKGAKPKPKKGKCWSGSMAEKYPKRYSRKRNAKVR